MRRFNGFSLMEMMVVLLIVAIVAAAAAPMVNKKILATAGEKSPWVFTGQNHNITFNVNGDTDTATIGAVNPPSSNPKLYIKTSDTEPHIMFGQGDQNNVASLRVSTDKLLISDVNSDNWQNSEDYVKLGSKGNIADNSVAVGFGAQVSEGSVSLGKNVSATGKNSIAIGGFSVASQSAQPGQSANLFGNAAWAALSSSGSSSSSSKEDSNGNEKNSNVSQQGVGAINKRTAATGENSIAIGYLTQAKAVSSVSIGAGASVTNDATNSVAIGAGAVADDANTIVLGDSSTKVIIPGILMAGGGAFEVQPNLPPVSRSSVTCNAPLTVNGETKLEDDTTVSGTLGVTGATALGGNTTVGGTLGVTGATTLGSTLEVTGVTTLVGGGAVLKNLHLTEDLVVVGSTYIHSGTGYYILGTGQVPLSATYTNNPSDRRLKNVGEVFTAGLEEIKKLEVFNYTFKKDESKTPRVGVMAQDLQKIFPQAVFKGEDGFLRIRMEDMFYALVNAVKQLDAKIEELKNNEILTLKNRLDDLEKANKELRKENEALEKRLDKLEKKLDKKLKD